ncbi:MAG: DMT family transporter [Pseudomonadota bacterium]
MTSNRAGALLALLAFALFATHDVFLKVLGNSYSPFQILFFAVLLGFPLTITMLLFDRTEANLQPRHPWWLGLRVVASLVGASCAVYAFATLPLSQTYSILFMMPLFVTVLAVPILGEKVGWRRALSVIAGVIGVAIVINPQSTTLEFGHLTALTAAVMSALASVILRKIGNEERSVSMLLIGQMATFFVMGGLMMFDYRPMPLSDLGLVALVALFGTAAMWVMIAAFTRAEAVIVSPMQYSQILWASAFGYLFFDEALSINTAIGAAVIIASGLYIVYRESGASALQPVLSSRDQRPALSIRPRIGDIFRLQRKGK